MNEIFKTPWGYVPYSYDDYLKLKELNKIFQKARVNAMRWKRWVRKAPHNRVEKIKIRNEQGQKIGSKTGSPIPEPITWEVITKKLVDVNRKPFEWFFGEYVEIDCSIETEYRKAKHPAIKKENLKIAEWNSGDIEKLLIQAKFWLNDL